MSRDCARTQFSEFTVPEIVIDVTGDAVTHQLTFVTDSAGDSNGDPSYCGERGFALANYNTLHKFVTLDHSTNLMTFQTSSEADLGEYQAELEVFLLENPSTSSSTTFTIKVIPC